MLDLRVSSLKRDIEDLEGTSFSKPAPLTTDQQIALLTVKALLNIAQTLDGIETAITDHD